MTMKIQIAKTDEEIMKCFDVMSQLRIHLDKQSFFDRVKRQYQQGYMLAYVIDKKHIVSVAGFRFMENLFLGKFMYIDDLITDANSRSKGYGDKLIDFLVSYAKTHGCKAVDLDSGVHRFDAHRFYMRKGMIISDHHFSLALEKMNYTPEAKKKK